MKKKDVVKRLMEAKEACGKTYDQLAESGTGERTLDTRGEVWITG